MYIEGQPSTASTAAYGVAAVDENDFEIDVNGTLSMIQPVQVVSWATGTDDEIEAMINGYYAGKLSLEDVKGAWSVGDVRQANETDKVKMKIAAHNSFSGDQTTSIPEQSTCKQVIINFDHDTLKTSIGSITKALVTIQMLGALGTSVSANADGRMNTSGTNDGGQALTARRTQCNGNFYNALGFKSQVKQVVKQNCANYQSSTITTTDDYCFLCSVYEIFGSLYSAPGYEGTQYKYFETSSNRVKGQGQEGTGETQYQQGRSVRSGYSYDFCMVDSSGGHSTGYASNRYGIAPACAL